MSFYDLVHARCSRRAYLPEPIPDEVLTRILEAARLAPSAANRQPWHFFVVRDETLRRRLFPHERQAWIAAAPVILVACSVPAEGWVRQYDGKNHADIDIAIVMEHIVLAATEEGLGSCWICAFDPEVFREVLELPTELVPIAATPLGYSHAEPRPRSRKALGEIVTWK